MPITDLTGKEPGAIICTATGFEYDKACRIIGVIWTGSTTTGDEAMVKGRLGSKQRVFWHGQTDSSNTYLGGIWGWPGLHAPDGFKIERLFAGTVYVYLSE